VSGADGALAAVAGRTETLAQSLDRIQHVAAEIIASINAPNEHAGRSLTL
jgi:hypothetical protein